MRIPGHSGRSRRRQNGIGRNQGRPEGAWFRPCGFARNGAQNSFAHFGQRAVANACPPIPAPAACCSGEGGGRELERACRQSTCGGPWPPERKGTLAATANVKKGQLTPSPEWWRHLRWAKRQFWKQERQAGKDLSRCEAQYETPPQPATHPRPGRRTGRSPE